MRHVSDQRACVHELLKMARSADAQRAYVWPMCVFKAPSVALLSNFRLLHSNDPRFSVRCGIEPGCSYSPNIFSFVQPCVSKA